MKKRAILFAGGVNSQKNFRRYGNDLMLAYVALKEKCDYTEEDISVFWGFGQCLNYNGANISTIIASKKLLIEKLHEISQELCEEDRFVFVVSNHGGENGFICMWGREVLEKQEFVELIGNIRAKKLIVMGQCYGGDFLDLAVPETCIIAANACNQVTYARLPELEYEEFLYHFFSFLYGKYPDVLVPIDQSALDIEKAFDFAFQNDQYNPKGCKYIDINICEIPQINNNVEDLKDFFIHDNQ